MAVPLSPSPSLGLLQCRHVEYSSRHFLHRCILQVLAQRLFLAYAAGMAGLRIGGPHQDSKTVSDEMMIRLQEVFLIQSAIIVKSKTADTQSS